MPRRPLSYITAALTSAAMVTTPFAPALAGGGSQYGNAGGAHYGNSGGFHGGMAPGCNNGGGSVVVNKPVSISKNINVYKPTTINNSVNVYKPVTINKNINVYKPTTINKNINVYKPVTINKNINITKNIDNSKNININKNVNINKNININKSIVINKGGRWRSAEASAFAQAMASASANASASVNNRSSCTAAAATNMSPSTIMAATFPASRPSSSARCRKPTWSRRSMRSACRRTARIPRLAHDRRHLDRSSYEGEVARCLPGRPSRSSSATWSSPTGHGRHLASGQVLECGPREAVRHYKDGMLKCAPAVPVPDCTERTNLRRYGTGDMFFSYRGKVCVSGH